MPRFLVLAFLAVVLASPVLADTRPTGTLWLSLAARKSAGPRATLPAQPGVTEGVVWVESVPRKVEEKLAQPARRWLPFLHGGGLGPPLPSIAQRGDAFSPRVIAVPAGANVEFANRDRLYHSTFSVSNARRFDLGKSSPGRRDTLAFEQPGVVNLHCEIHPGAVGYVVVTPNRAYARPDSAGRFRLPKLPPGRYVLHAWHPQQGELKLPFVVPKRGSVSLDPTF